MSGRLWVWIVFLIVLTRFGATVRAEVASRHFQSGEWGGYEVFQPKNTPQGLVFLFSPAGGPGAPEQAAIAALTAKDLAVALVDSRIYLTRVGGASPRTEDCLELPGAVLWASHWVQKELGFAAYQSAYLAGRGVGSSLVWTMLAQSSHQAFAAGFGADFSPQLPVGRPLCEIEPRGEPYQRPLPKEHILGSPWQHLDTPGMTYGQWLAHGIQAHREAHIPNPAVVHDMPIIEVASHSQRDVLVVFYSGDGGWRDIDKALAEYLAGEGFAVLGVDALSYFWSALTPQQVGHDLIHLLAHYQKAWNLRQVVLVGYSFGADILPFAYNRLPPEVQRQVILLSLLAPGRAADFEIRVLGWLGADPSAKALPLAPEIASIPKPRIQCLYGLDEAARSLCTEPSMATAEVISTSGSHHFDGDYATLGKRLFEGILRRLDTKNP
ncbi:Virulence factor family protein [Gammaproteobacteria bacterium]